jgi:hypothetical protein
MLSRSDLKYNFGFLRLACALNLLPIEFGGMDGGVKMKVQKSSLRQFIFNLWQFYGLFCSLCISSRSAWAVAFGMYGQAVKLHQTVTYVIFSIAFGASSYGTAILFPTHLDLTIKLFNELTGHFGKTEGFEQGGLNEFFISFVYLAEQPIESCWKKLEEKTRKAFNYMWGILV